MNKILLVTEQPQNAAGGGAVIIRSLVEEFIGESILWASTNGIEDYTRGYVKLNRGSAGGGSFSPFADSTIYRKSLADEVLAVSSEHGVTKIWFVVHGAITRIAAEVVRRSSLAIHSTVHDDPPYATALRSVRLLPLVYHYARDLKFLLHNSVSVDVVCKGMSDYYQRKYGIRSSVVHRALSKPTKLGLNIYSSVHRDGLRIGVLGNTYGYHQLSVLAKAMINASKVIGKKSTLIICGHSFGNKIKSAFGGSIDVEVMGHVDENTGIEMLKTCTALYLNYPFGWRDKILRETSFPTKLSTYVSVARPLILHCPDRSSILQVNENKGYCYHWNTMSITQGAQMLDTVWRNTDITRSYVSEAEEVRSRFFDLSTNKQLMVSLLWNDQQLS